MMIFRSLAFGTFLFIAPASAREPVALTYQISGNALRTDPGRPAKPLRLYDHLPAGAVLELKPGCRLALAFITGKRYAIAGPARATLGKGDLAARSGDIRPLPSSPPLPHLAAIAEDEKPGPEAGAVNIRGGEIGGLFPRQGATTFVGATILRFQSAAARYQVEIEDYRGNVIFHKVTESRSVDVPAGVLKPGASYHWTVKALDVPGPVARGEADFVTLSQEDAAARTRLREALVTLGDEDSRALLTAVDQALGLMMEETREEDGAVVESVEPLSPGQATDLRPGDLILSWASGAASNPVRSPYDLIVPEIEEAPRHPILLAGRRGEQAMSWRLTAGEWGVRTRPSHPEDLAGWSQSQRARELAKAGKWSEADVAYSEALAILERQEERLPRVQLLHEWGETFENRGAWNDAVERYEKALALARAVSPKSLAEARDLDSLGITAAKRHDFPTAEKFLRQALEIREELAPGTAEVTGSLNNLGILTYRRGNPEAAMEYLKRGEELQRRLAPESADHALFFQNLGNVSGALGDREKAESYQRQALAIFEKIDPRSREVARVLVNVGNILLARGDLAAAEELYQRSLDLQEQEWPGELEIETPLITLGIVASRRGDLETAEALYRRALEIQQKLSPDSPSLAFSLSNLGIVLGQHGAYAEAREYLRRSMDIEKKLIPGSLGVAASLEQLGRLELDAGNDLDLAENLLRQALTKYQEKEPESLDASDIWRDLGEVATRRGHPREAIPLHQQALSLRHRFAPGTAAEAEALHLLGGAERRAGQIQEGTRHLCAAIDVLDRQRSRLGGTPEAKAFFEASLASYYQDCLTTLLQLGRPFEAFHALERGRARAFLTLLSERDLRLADLSPELRAERSRVDTEYDEVQSRLAHLSSGQEVEVKRLTGEIRELRARQEEILARMRRESPRSAALQDPRPLDLASARAALDPGTVLLEYAVGQKETRLFVVQPAKASGPGLSVFRIPAGEKTLREEVEGFRRLLGRPLSDRAALGARARRLYRLLIHPAESRIAGARRLLISPDGPLHILPFAALRRGDRYLIEWKPVHSALSATVYAELIRSRPGRRSLDEERLDSFGDPAYPTALRGGDSEVREALRRGLSLTPLPSTRREVQAISILFPQGHEYLGPDATEERAKALGSDSQLIHFACHGLIDERFPLNSALALSVPEHPAEGQDNGLLQAWEIFESVRLNADLVTLSACDTALGKEMGGEGLIGLTRAFQYAGARSVLASLWGVADHSTATFMKDFYGHLRAGKTKDEALRAAQIDQIRKKPGSSHPFYWAAFQLTGDWR
jgi:CHAT domain-containing protein/Tfp pilus assembly protein PilF